VCGKKTRIAATYTCRYINLYDKVMGIINYSTGVGQRFVHYIDMLKNIIVHMTTRVKAEIY